MLRSRLVRICYDRLVTLQSHSPVNCKYNWTNSVRCMLEDIGYGHIWESQDATAVAELFEAMSCKMCILCIDQDVSRLTTSSSNPLYYLSWSQWSAAKYLKYSLPFCVKAVVAQIRLQIPGCITRARRLC